MKNIFFTDDSVKINWFNSEKYFFTVDSVKRLITDSISENLTDSDLESWLDRITLTRTKNLSELEHENCFEPLHWHKNIHTDKHSNYFRKETSADGALSSLPFKPNMAEWSVHQLVVRLTHEFAVLFHLFSSSFCSLCLCYFHWLQVDFARSVYLASDWFRVKVEGGSLLVTVSL